MAANRFATMLHRNTNKFTLILMYAVLEWILILFLLLNSLFSYVIIKFAEYFGLNPPCLLCSRVDHIFEPAKKNQIFRRDLICEVHAKEIARLGYCSNHQKLVDSQDVCEDCLSSRPELDGVSKNVTLLPWIKEFGREKVGQNGEVSLKCSCCGLLSDNNKYASYKLIPSWDVLECAHKANLIEELGEDDNHIQEVHKSYEILSDYNTDLCDFEHGLEDSNNRAQVLSDFGRDFNVAENKDSVSVSANELKELEGEGESTDVVIMKMEEEKENIMVENSTIAMEDKAVQVSIQEEKDVSLHISPQHLEFFLDNSGHRLVPIELVDLVTDNQDGKNCDFNEDNDKHGETNLDSEVWLKTEVKMVVEDRFRREEGVVLDFSSHEDPKYMMLDSMEIEEDENSLVFHAKECRLGTRNYEQDRSSDVAQPSSQPIGDVQETKAAEGERIHSRVLPVHEEAARLSNCETEADVSIGTEIPDLDMADEIKNQYSLPSYEFTHEDPLATFSSFAADFHGPLQVQEENMELKALSIRTSEDATNEQPSFYLQLNDIDEDKVPDTPVSTPTGVDSMYHLHKKFPMLEKKDSGAEESLDGSVTSELEGGDGVVTVERLKSALRSERKTLRALYAELEEERNASAEAASQTLAMINRLQEEKAAMQMEALQYQRMMEEQSEYDQEALQLLNELMVKREKEKQELEKELEIYRKKVLDYETKEKMRILRISKDASTRSGFSSASCSNADDSDGLSIDLNQEAKVEDCSDGHLESSNQNTPLDAAIDLDNSLTDFEEERLSILEQLKVLEEKLITLDIEEEEQHANVWSMEDVHEENENHVEENGYIGGEANGHANGFAKEINGKHHQQRRIAAANGKQLLPLFDAISEENGDVLMNGNGNANGLETNGVHHSYQSKLELDNKNFFVEEELDHLYERLQALEADREFLKHCFSSLRKGDKGIYLLQEILQHLRDLRNVELRVRNLSDTAVV